MSQTDELKSALEKALGQAVENARREDRAIAKQLLSARRNAFGTAVILIAAFTVAVAAFFQRAHPQEAAITVVFAFVSFIVGAWHLEMVNRARQKLAKKLDRHKARFGEQQ